MQRAEVAQKQSARAPLRWNWEGTQRAGRGSGCFSWPCPLAGPSMGNPPRAEAGGESPHRVSQGAQQGRSVSIEGTQHRTTWPWSLVMVLGVGVGGHLDQPGH